MRAEPSHADDPVGPMTFEEFLEFEEKAEFKHEFINGYAFPHGDWATGLAGAGRRHNRIAAEIQRLLGNLVDVDHPDCFAYGSDMMLYIPNLDKSYYPDVQLACDPSDQNERYLTSPCLIVEVLSGTTSRTDVGEKLLAYQGIPSLQAYWIVAQRQAHITRWWRSTDGVWADEELTSGEVPVPCLSKTLSIDAIYARV